MLNVISILYMLKGTTQVYNYKLISKSTSIIISSAMHKDRREGNYFVHKMLIIKWNEQPWMHLK